MLIPTTFFAQLNYLHRMATRVVFVLLWTHASGKVSLSCFLLGYNNFLMARSPCRQLALNGCVVALELNDDFLSHTLCTACRIYPGFWDTIWLHMGVTAITALSLLILVSLRPVRAKSYQLFFWIHFALVL
jgi:ferric-chelate reductase